VERTARTLVCGLGASGAAAARLLRTEGAEVLALDERDGPELREGAGKLQAEGIRVVLGCDGVPEGAFAAAVVSPGIPPAGALLSAVRARGIPLISELELGWSRFRGRTLAVTGSHGKSSVVKALAEALGAAGHRAVPCGNYGLPVCRAVRETPDADWLVIEASSFQLETCRTFRPDIGVLLNILPNHLDRHGDMETYANLKARLFVRQQAEDTALVPPEWLERMREWSAGRGTWRTFGADGNADFRWSPGRLTERGGDESGIAGSFFDNDVLGPAAAAVWGAARQAGVPASIVRDALVGFDPLPHRSQLVAERGGVRFVDDSKATSLSALAASIRMQPGPIRLIAGGRPKESDFGPALPALREQVGGVFLIGEAAGAMAAAWNAAVPCRICGTLERAVAEARAAAAPGDTVLLAPGCTSYDQFRSYAERGKRFAELLREKG